MEKFDRTLTLLVSLDIDIPESIGIEKSLVVKDQCWGSPSPISSRTCHKRKVTEFSSLQILQSGCNPRHLNSRAFLDCSGLHLDYMDYMVIKWIAEQGNPKQSKGNLCNPSAIHCNIGLQFGFAIQSNLCNLTAMQEDCSQIAEIALWLLRLHSKKSSLTYIYSCSFQGYSGRLHHVCTLIVEIAVWLWRLQSDCSSVLQFKSICVI